MENGSNANPTPAQRAGFQVGDSAIVIGETNGFSDGQRVTLYEDDGTDAPLWRGDNWEFKDLCAPGVPGAYLLLNIEVRRPTERDWTEWPGGPMPVDGDTLVDVRFRNNSICKGSSAGRFRWQHIPQNDDIVAYRISKPKPETQNEPAAKSRGDGTLTGAALHRAIADAIDAGEGPEVFERWSHMAGNWVAHSTFKGLVTADSWGVKIRRKLTMRSATLPSGETIEWPAPMTTEPSRDQLVFRAEPGERNSISFRFNPSSNLHQRLLRARVLYSDSDSAEKHGVAVAELNGGEVAGEDR